MVKFRDLVVIVVVVIIVVAVVNTILSSYCYLFCC